LEVAPEGAFEDGELDAAGEEEFAGPDGIVKPQAVATHATANIEPTKQADNLLFIFTSLDSIPDGGAIRSRLLIRRIHEHGPDDGGFGDCTHVSVEILAESPCCTYF
jgi:hypothetical protein